MQRRQRARWFSAAVVLTAWAAPALAQAPATPPPSAPAAGTTSTSGSVGFGASTETGASTTATAEASPPPPPPAVAAPVPPPPPPPPPPPAVEPPAPGAERTDHEKVVGALGVGLLSSMEIFVLQPGPSYTEQPLRVATLGIRHWLDEGLGFEVAFGFNTSSGTREDTIIGRKDVPDPTVWGLGLHAGLPLSFYHDAHYNFLLIPELNLGYASGKLDDDPNLAGDQAVDSRAFLLGVGARIGAEVQLGMIDLPMLALQGTIGANFNYRYASTEAAESDVLVRRVRSRIEASTASYDDPWDVFVSSIAALYYFR